MAETREQHSAAENGFTDHASTLNSPVMTAALEHFGHFATAAQTACTTIAIGWKTSQTFVISRVFAPNLLKTAPLAGNQRKSLVFREIQAYSA